MKQKAENATLRGRVLIMQRAQSNVFDEVSLIRGLHVLLNACPPPRTVRNPGWILGVFFETEPPNTGPKL